VVTVPTPSEADGSFGLHAVLAAVRAIGAQAERLASRHVVVLKSTVSPGATDGSVRAALSDACGPDTSIRPGLVHAPEFHAIGTVVRDITHPYLLILGGEEDWALSRAEELHSSLAPSVVSVTRLDAVGAELAKLASNSFRTMKIAFANSLAELSTAYETDPQAICSAVGADPHIGGGYLVPGLPYGGPCYPRDNPALRAAAEAVGVGAPLPEAIEVANELRFREIERCALAAPPGPIGIIGIGFKLGVEELEGSPALELAGRLENAGRQVMIHDPLATDSRFTAVSLAALVGSCVAVILATPDERISRDLEKELRSREHPPLTVDPWCALSQTPREVSGTHPPMSRDVLD
jgi:UDPglucose 6-dehydrogenase